MRLRNLLFKPSGELHEVWWDFIAAAALNLAFVGVVALVLWLAGNSEFTVRLVKGYALLWVVVVLVSVAVTVVHRIFRMSIYDRSGAYVASGLLGSGVLVTGWSAFAALSVQGFVGGASPAADVVLWVVGVFSTVIGWFVVTADYGGAIYKFVSLPLALVSFVVFALWPDIARAGYGWFFEFF